MGGRDGGADGQHEEDAGLRGGGCRREWGARVRWGVQSGAQPRHDGALLLGAKEDVAAEVVGALGLQQEGRGGA